MKNKKSISKKYKIVEINKFRELIKNKINLFKTIISNTFFHIDKIKLYDIISSSEQNSCVGALEVNYCALDALEKKLMDNYNDDEIITTLQEINNELSMIIKKVGTHHFEDFLKICFDNTYINKLHNLAQFKDKFNVLLKFFHPISYTAFLWNNKVKGKKNTITEDYALIREEENLSCHIINKSNSFHESIYGIKLVLHDEKQKVSLIVKGIISEIPIKCLNNNYIQKQLSKLNSYKTIITSENMHIYKQYTDALTIKDLLIYDSNKLYDNFKKNLIDIELTMNKNLQDIIKSFLELSLINKRNTLLSLLLFVNNKECEYLSYLLYDLLTTDNNGTIDNYEQTLLFDSFPLIIKNNFKKAMHETLKYTELLYGDKLTVPLEQQICLLKTNNSVKEKAMTKLKELKAKSEDSGTKAKQYLEGLLKIPFGKYRLEEILLTVNNSIEIYKTLIDQNTVSDKYNYNNINTDLTLLKTKIIPNQLDSNKEQLFTYFTENKNRQELIISIKSINKYNKDNKLKHKHLCFSGKNTNDMRLQISNMLKLYDNNNIMSFCTQFNIKNIISTDIYNNKLLCLENNINTIKTNIENIESILDNAVYGHKNAKRQIQRILGQWMVGTNDGYCFGFEGPPGVGKTSLAQKGISLCLKDNNNNPRPFSFIAIGGSSNGSTLEGHNYTYVGSTWGRIVDILIESKCMNPIIFIDELDKISNTEQGKEIIGILTHLIDPSQNTRFQDKYFSGIDLDLSKALFIFSYNDVSLIDRILLDRIHRIKFDRLTIMDKIEICKDFLIPEITEKLNLNTLISIDDEMIRYIINSYTRESGVRKLKEILFELFSEINLDILTSIVFNDKLKITKEILNKYLKTRDLIVPYKIHQKSSIGLINGLWANALGLGGVLPIEVKFIPGPNYLDLKLTGMQGDVMKESMNVAKTVMWDLLTPKQKENLENKHKNEIIHIHCPDGATPKDGPSAGTAIGILLYSLCTGKKIKHNFAITGELNLQHKVTEIGGLDSKIIGGIEGNVTNFIYPKSNEKDFKKFYDKYKETNILDKISFHAVETIEDAIKLIIVK